jgi:hypothetical protein
MKNEITVLAIAIGLFILSPTAQADPLQNGPNTQHQGGGQPHPMHEPPPNAYEACKGKKEGDAVQLNTPKGVVPAHCHESPKGMFARPPRPPA